MSARPSCEATSTLANVTPLSTLRQTYSPLLNCVAPAMITLLSVFAANPDMSPTPIATPVMVDCVHVSPAPTLSQ